MNAKKYFIEIFQKNPQQDPVIDAIRGLSVLSIIAFHVTIGIIQIYDHAKATQYILDMPTYLQPLWHGEKGVDAFFLLSALVIGLSVFKKIEQYDLKAAFEFLRKKLFRIYPLFLVALILYTIGQWSYFGKYFFSNLFFVNNIIPGERTIIPVGWFLTVEVQYFVLLPIIFLFLKKIRYRGIALTGLFLSSILVCASVLTANSDLFQRPITDLFLASDRSEFSSLMGRAFYESDLTRFGPFVLGLLLAYLKVFYSEKLGKFFQNNSNSVFIFSALFILFPVLMPMYDPSSWYYQPFSPQRHLWVLAISRQIFALGISLLIWGCWYSGSAFNVINKIMSWSVWRPLSRLSYPIYLFHFPFIAVAAVLIFGTTNIKEIEQVTFLNGLLIFILATVLTMLFSIPLYTFIERPLIMRSKKSTRL